MKKDGQSTGNTMLNAGLPQRVTNASGCCVSWPKFLS